MRTRKAKKNEKVYVFRVSLQSGPHDNDVPEKIWREVEALESHSLYQLANIIIESFDFQFDHCFGFYSNFKDSYHTSKFQCDLFTDLDDIEPTGADSVKKTKVKKAFLEVGDRLLFFFDYGDGWRFAVELREIKKPGDKTVYPFAAKSYGKAPEQYPIHPDDAGDACYDEELSDPEEMEEEVKRMLENMSPEDFEKITKRFEEMGLSGQIVAVNDDNAAEAGPLIEYIGFHNNIKEGDYQNISEKKLKNHIQNLGNSKLDLFEQKKNIMVLGHTGKLEAYEALKEYADEAESELAFWTEQALGECEMFLKSDLLDRPMVEFKELKEN